MQTSTPRRAQPQFWRVTGRTATGQRVQRIVYAAGNVQAEAQACALAGISPDELIGASCMRITTPGLLLAPMPAGITPLSPGYHPAITQDQLDAATSGMAFDDYEVARQAREDHNRRTVLRGADLLYAVAAVLIAAGTVLLLATTELPYSPSVASTVSEVLP